MRPQPYSSRRRQKSDRAAGRGQDRRAAARDRPPAAPPPSVAAKQRAANRASAGRAGCGGRQHWTEEPHAWDSKGASSAAASVGRIILPGSSSTTSGLNAELARRCSLIRHTLPTRCATSDTGTGLPRRVVHRGAACRRTRAVVQEAMPPSPQVLCSQAPLPAPRMLSSCCRPRLKHAAWSVRRLRWRRLGRLLPVLSSAGTGELLSAAGNLSLQLRSTSS